MKWIKCSDRLPEEYEKVIVYVPTKGRFFSSHIEFDCVYKDYKSETYWREHPGVVTKWMPLPDGDNDEEQ